MRTTVEITAAQHRALTSLANLRALRGFSALVQEALDAYLGDLVGDELDVLLGLEGSLTHDEAAALEERIDAAWASWPTAS